MFTKSNKAGVKMTTCEEMASACNTYQPRIEVIGEWIHHSGQEVWIRLAGCGESDSHTYNHFHDNPVYMNRMFADRVVRLIGERNYDWSINGWIYRWSIVPVNGTNC